MRECGICGRHGTVGKIRVPFHRDVKVVGYEQNPQMYFYESYDDYTGTRFVYYEIRVCQQCSLNISKSIVKLEEDELNGSD